MNKNQLVYVIGMGIAGAIGGLTTWYAGRKSYKQGFKDGCEITIEVQMIIDELKNKLNKKD